jgi:hypothetical protein
MELTETALLDFLLMVVFSFAALPATALTT